MKVNYIQSNGVNYPISGHPVLCVHVLRNMQLPSAPLVFALFTLIVQLLAC